MFGSKRDDDESFDQNNSNVTRKERAKDVASAPVMPLDELQPDEWSRTMQYISEENLEGLSHDMCDPRILQRVLHWRNEHHESIVALMVQRRKYDLLKILIGNIPLEDKDYLLNKVSGGHRRVLPLHIAARNNDLKMVQLLVYHGADVRVQDKYGFTPLHRAAHDGYIAICKFLLECGADLFVRDNSGYTSWMRACSKGKLDICKLFLDVVREQHMTPMLIKSDNEMESSLNTIAFFVREQTEEMVALAVNEAGFDVNHKSSVKNMAPLHCATVVGNTAAVQALLRHGADPNILNATNSTVLHLAVDYGHLEICRMLLDEEDIDVGIADMEGRNPRELAMSMQRFDIVNLFDNDPRRRFEVSRANIRSPSLSISNSVRLRLSQLAQI